MKYKDLSVSIRVIIEVVFAFLVLAFLWLVRNIILLLILALILASAMDPLVDYLHHKKIPRSLSVIMVYIVFLSMAILVVYLMIPPVVTQFKILKDNLPQYSQALQSQFGGYDIQGTLQNMLSGFSDSGGVVKGTFGVFNGALDVIAVLVISFYLVAEEKGMKTFVGSLIPERHQEVTLSVLAKIQKKMGLWVLGQLIVSLGIFVFTYVGLLAIGMKQYALVLALVAGLFEVVPYIGPFLSAIPAMFVGFIQSPSLVFWVAFLYVLVHEFEGYVLVPKIMEKTVGTSPLLVLMALLIGYQLAGVVGLVISVPLATALTVVTKEFWTDTKLP